MLFGSLLEGMKVGNGPFSLVAFLEYTRFGSDIWHPLLESLGKKGEVDLFFCSESLSHLFYCSSRIPS